jgi:hypothetical protein
MKAPRILRALRRWRGETAETPEPFTMTEPGLPVRRPLPSADSTQAGPAYTIPEECRLHILAEWLGTAGGGARGLGADLADELRAGLPGVRDCDIARVLLALEPVLERIAGEQEDPLAALLVIRDSLLGAPVALAELDLALAERGLW